jgi:hypothetical protein
MPKLPFYFRQMTVPNGLIPFCPLCSSSFSGMPRTSKSFKLPTFWLLDSTFGSRRWLKQKDIIFLGKQIVTLSPAVPIKLTPLSTSHLIISHSCILIISCFSTSWDIILHMTSICFFMDCRRRYHLTTDLLISLGKYVHTNRVRSWGVSSMIDNLGNTCNGRPS